MSNVVREFFLGFIKIHMLFHAQREGFCGVDMMKELSRHGYSIGPGTLYPILHRMGQAGFLLKEKRVENGRLRIYYRTTRKGRSALQHAKSKIRELVCEVLQEK